MTHWFYFLQHIILIFYIKHLYLITAKNKKPSFCRESDMVHLIYANIKNI